MKKKGLLIILIIVLIVLSGTLYFFIANSPKRIENESIGTMYTFGQISFNLTSDQYEEIEEVRRASEERGRDPNQLIALHNEQSTNSITIWQRTEEEDKRFFDTSIKLLSHPILKTRITNLLRERSNEMGEALGEGEEESLFTLYEGKNKIAILYTLKRNGVPTFYNADIRIDNQYYTIIPHNQDEQLQLALENIMEFIRTVNINQ